MNSHGILISFLFVGLVGCGGSGDGPRVIPAPTLKSITVFPSTGAIDVGETLQYSAVVKDSNQNIVKNVEVEWSVGHATIAQISEMGLLTGVRAGTTTVSASRGNLTSQLVTVTVEAVQPPPPPPVIPPVIPPVVPPVVPPPVIPPVVPPPVIPPVVPPVVPPVTRAKLPPWLTYCVAGACDGIPPVVAALCPSSDPCVPVRQTTVLPQVNGSPINALAFPLVNIDPAHTLRVLSGDAEASANMLFAYSAPSVLLKSEQQALLTYYAIAPNWGGTNAVNFLATEQSSASLTTVFYRHPSYDTGTAAAQLHSQGQTIITALKQLTGITSAQKVTAYFLPTELAAATRLGEGNFSFGNGTVTINYSNPDFIAFMGGILKAALPRFAHEYVHELFDEIDQFFLDNPSCLNEGLADAVAYLSGFLPVEDFGPMGLRGLDFRDGCLPMTAMHDIGNCYLWHLHEAGLLTPAVVHGLFHPQHTFVFDSCQMNAETGNSLLVYFTEAANGANLLPVLDAMGLPHAESYVKAREALGL